MILSVLLQNNYRNTHMILNGFNRNGQLHKIVETTKKSEDCSYRKM